MVECVKVVVYVDFIVVFGYNFNIGDCVVGFWFWCGSFVVFGFDVEDVIF